MTADLRNAVLERLKRLYPPRSAAGEAESAPQNPRADADSGRKDIVSLGLVSDIFIAAGKVFFSITAPPEQAAEWEGLRREAEKAAAAVGGAERVFVTLTSERQARAVAKAAAPAGNLSGRISQKVMAGAPQSGRLPPAARQPLLGVKHIITVASGKGGVGKSTMAINIAAALQASGLKTGLLDADIYGPSLPRLTGIIKPQGKDIVHFQDKKIVPLERFGLKLMSMGFLVETEAPLVWRGPMVMGAVRQLLYDVAWAPLDILVVDMPPGTGDAQLTLAQKVLVSGAIIVSTPQELALLDARKAIEMFAKIHVPILGIIENMSYFIAPDTGRRYAVFGGIDASGKGGAEREALKRNLPFLGALPLDPALEQSADKGEPIILSAPQSALAAAYRAIAQNIMRQLHLAQA